MESGATVSSSTLLNPILGPRLSLMVRNGHVLELVTVLSSMTTKCGYLVAKTMIMRSLTTFGVTLSNRSSGHKLKLTPKLFQDLVTL